MFWLLNWSPGWKKILLSQFISNFMSLTVNRCQTNRFRRTEMIHFFHFIRVFYILDTQISSFFFKLSTPSLSQQA